MGRNIYQEVTDKIVAALESGAGDYTQPWTNLSGGALPRNAQSGKRYRGINVLALWAEGHTSTYWATYQQWQALGAQVRKGEKSSTVVFFQQILKKGAPEPQPGEESGKDDFFPVLKYYSVFNLAQVDAIANEDGTPGTIKLPEGDTQIPETHAERIAAAEAFFAALPARVVHGGDRACFSPDRDIIRMPDFRQFQEAEAYYSTLAHEQIHWSGHKSRLDRTFGKRFGDQQYAVEELVAELGAAFTMAITGLSAEPRQDHAQYLGSWLKVLKQDPKAIFTIAAKAQAAAEYLTNLAGVITATVEAVAA